MELTGEYTPDLTALLSADIIISTPEKWDGISRNWHSRSYVKKVNNILCSTSVQLARNVTFCCSPISFLVLDSHFEFTLDYSLKGFLLNISRLG